MNARCIEFDFPTRTKTEISRNQIALAREQERYVWIDADTSDASGVVEMLRAHAPLPALAQERIVTGRPETRCDRYEKHLHIALVGCRFESGELRQSRVDVVLGPGLLVTLTRGPVEFVEGVRETYAADFERFAKTPSFLLYEVCDHLTRSYELIEREFERRVHGVHAQLVGMGGKENFNDVARVSSSVLAFRKVVAPTRDLLFDLSSRRTDLVSEQTQEYLRIMVGEHDRILNDLSANRDILNDSINLHVSMIGYRTSRVLGRLTIISFAFLPLTFLVGVFSLTRDHLPGLDWKISYASFWLFVVFVFTVSILLYRRISRS